MADNSFYKNDSLEKAATTNLNHSASTAKISENLEAEPNLKTAYRSFYGAWAEEPVEIVPDPKDTALLIMDMQNTCMADKEPSEEIARHLKRVTGNDYSADRRFISSLLLVSVRNFGALFHVKPYLGWSVAEHKA